MSAHSEMEETAKMPGPRGARARMMMARSRTNKGGKPSRKLGLSARKLKKILDDGEVHGEKLTPAQRGMFGAALAAKRKK